MLPLGRLRRRTEPCNAKNHNRVMLLGSGTAANSAKFIWSYKKSVLSSANVKPASVRKLKNGSKIE